MSTVEDKLRQALEATASEIRSTRVPTLGLVPLSGRGRASLSFRWRRSRWAAPVAATAAVAVVIALSAAIGTRAGSHHDAGSSVLARLGPGTTVPLHAAPAVDGGAVPAYYIVIHGPSTEVQATATGAVLAMVQSAGDFIAVSGAADDRTFVLAAAAKSRTDLYLLRLNPQAGTARLNALPIAVPNGGSLQFAALALSPDGRKLAVAVNNWSDTSTVGARIWVYDLATGSRREWLWPEGGRVSEGLGGGPGRMSWAADDKTLAFEVNTGVLEGVTTVRLLDTAAPGTDLSRSRVVLRTEDIRVTPHSQLESPLITADGSTIVLGHYQAAGLQLGSAGNQGSILPVTLSIDEYSTRTGYRIAIVFQRRYNVPQTQSGNLGPQPSVLWANASGTILIVSTGAPLAAQSPELGILRDGTFTPLRVQGTALTESAAW